jgi:aminopeptidase-like protein
MNINKIINDIYDLGKNKLFPITRSITGQGVRDTLGIIKKYIPGLKIYNVKSGTKVFDWKVPPEWNIKNAYILDKFGKKIIDFKNHNLHIAGYSVPTKKVIRKDELLKKINSLPLLPDAIPYVISYYKKYWGFSSTHKQKIDIIKKYKKDDKFKVVIDSSLDKNGSLTYGEFIIPGKSKKEIFISTYVCHPSMANNELSGPMVSSALIKYFSKKKIPMTLRFAFVTETIGAITYLSKRLDKLKKNVVAGYVLTCIGDDRNYSYLYSKHKNSPSDTAAVEAFKKLKIKFKKYYFNERGSDERQYNSPGIDLGLGSICRSKHSNFKEYHTSLDDFTLVTKTGLKGGFNVAKKTIEILFKKEFPKNLTLCEPQMGRRNLYPMISGYASEGKDHLETKGFMDFLQYANGKTDLLEISKLINLSLKKTKYIHLVLKKNKLVD